MVKYSMDNFMKNYLLLPFDCLKNSRVHEKLQYIIKMYTGFLKIQELEIQEKESEIRLLLNMRSQL